MYKPKKILVWHSVNAAKQNKRVRSVWAYSSLFGATCRSCSRIAEVPSIANITDTDPSARTTTEQALNSDVAYQASMHIEMQVLSGSLLKSATVAFLLPFGLQLGKFLRLVHYYRLLAIGGPCPHLVSVSTV